MIYYYLSLREGQELKEWVSRKRRKLKKSFWKKVLTNKTKFVKLKKLKRAKQLKKVKQVKQVKQMNFEN